MGEGSTKTVLTLAFRPSSHRHFFSVNLKESQAQVKISQAKNSKFIFVLILTFDQISRRVGPPPPVVSTKSTQPPLLWSEIG